MCYTEIILIVLIALFTWLWVRSRRPRNVPPGPTPLPVLGNLLEMFDGDFLKTTRRLRQQFGDIFTLSMGKFWVIVVNGPDVIREILTKKGHYMLDRPQFLLFDITEYQGIGSANGMRWKENRNLTIQKLRQFVGNQSFESKIAEELEVFLDSLRKESEEAVDIENKLCTSLSNIMMKMINGRRFDYTDQRYKHLMDLTRNNFRRLELVGYLSFFPFLSKLPGDPFKIKSVRKDAERGFRFLKKEVDIHIHDFDDNNIDDLTDAFIKEAKCCNSPKESTVTVDQLQFIFQDLYTTGMEIPSAVIRWWFLFMIHHPKCQDKMYDEINNVVGHGRLPKLSDELPYSKAIIYETLRLGNSAPFSVPYCVTEEFIFNDYRFPVGAVVYVSLDSVMMDESHFPNSQDFRPDRFIDPDGNLCDTEKVMAFSFGRRRCIGERFALMELFLYCTSLIQSFRFLPPTDEDFQPIRRKCGLTSEPLSFKMRILQRT